MDTLKFDEIVQEYETRNPFWFEGEREPIVTEHDLATFEKLALCILPENFRYFVMNHGTGDFAFVFVLSIRDGENSILEQCKYLGEQATKYLPVSDNGCGDYYAFRVEAGSCSNELFFLDHEQNYAASKSGYADFLDYVVEVGLRIEK